MENHNTQWMEQDVDFLIDNYLEKGEDYCAKHLGRSNMSISCRVKTTNFDTTKYINDQDKALLDKFYPLFGFEFCQAKINQPDRILRTYIRQNRLKKLPLSDVSITDYILDFIGKWNPHFVYILGLIWADGCLRATKQGTYTASFGLVSQDANDVTNSLEDFGIWKWTKFIQKPRADLRKNGKWSYCQESTKWSLNSITFGQFLFENDYRIKSGASAEKILSIIPDELKHYWWRGFFEGDGHLKPDKCPKIQIAGKLEQDWTFLANLLDSLGIECSIYRNDKREKGKSSQVSFGKINDVIKFCDYIWQNRETDNIGFERKYNTYKSKNYQPYFNTSQRAGVCYYETGNHPRSWHVNFKRKHYGRYATEEEAIKRIEEVEKEHGYTKDSKLKKSWPAKYDGPGSGPS